MSEPPESISAAGRSTERSDSARRGGALETDANLSCGSSHWASPFVLSVFGGLLYWLALPPCNLWPLAWLAPLAWTPIVTRSVLPGRRPYLKLWLAGYLFWSAAVYWITLPHWSAAIGWFFMAGYLGCYFPAFLLVSRLAVHRLRVPAEIAMPIAWVAMELLRAYVFTGFLMAALGHTQYKWLALVQLSDLVGAYGVSFVVMFVGVCVAQALPYANEARTWRHWRLVPGVFVLVAAVAYGRGRLEVAAEMANDVPPSPRIALIQGTLDTQFGQSREEVIATRRRTYEQYLALSLDAVREHPGVSLVVWPESMYPLPLVTFHDLAAPPENIPADVPEFTREHIAETARQIGVPLLLAVNGEDYHRDGMKWYNTSIHVGVDEETREATIDARYDKMHPVIFGEYVPFGDEFPWLYSLTPLGGGLTAGEKAIAIEVATGEQSPPLLAAPNICFESVVPHLMRRQMLQLREEKREPDVLITQTNDGWFWGSAGLDMHLVCNVFRAVELRKPHLAAANTGISAWVDHTGRIVEQLPRRTPGFIVATPQRSTLESFYLRGGDWFAAGCLGLAVIVLCAGTIRRKTQSPVDATLPVV